MRSPARTITPLLLLLVTMLLCASDLRATEVLDDWALELVERIDPQAPGEGTRVVLDLFTHQDIDVEMLGVSAVAGWKGLQHASLAVDAAEKTPVGVTRQRFEISGVLEDSSVPVRVHLRVDGQEFFEELDFSRRATDGAVRIPDTRVALPLGTLQRLGGPETLVTYEQKEQAGPESKDTTIRFRGVIALRRPDGTVVGADRVKVKIHDDEGGYNNGLVEGFTDATGGFDLSFDWNYGVLIDPEPDLVVSVELGNEHVDVRSTSIVSGNYSFEVWRQHDYVGTPDVNLGTIVPSNPSMHGAMYIHTFMERTYRWFNSNGYTLPHTVIRWPADASFYRSLTGVIFMGAGQEWVEGTLGHEYTHGFVRNFGVQDNPEYCNGLCGGDIDGCKHCAYCQETLGTAWSEGFPDFVTQTMNGEFNTTYALTPLSLGPYFFETIGQCGELPGGPAVDDQFMTEGIFAGFCYDMVDTPADNDPAFSSTWSDASSIDPVTLLDVAATYDPRYVQEFLDALESHMKASPSYGTQDIEDLWETGQNNGYEFDDTVPTVVSNLNSNTHLVGVSSPANLPQFYWNTALDDASGIDGYGISLTLGSAAMPSATKDIGRVNGYAFDTPVAPGTYWFNIRAVDRSGKWSTAYASVGPIIIGTALPAQLAPHVPEFWSDALVCLPNGVGNIGFVPAPTVLNGGVMDTRVFFAYKNNSVSSTAHSGWKSGVHFDGVGTWKDASVPAGVVTAAQEFPVALGSSYLIPGGRHTVGLYIDREQDLAESDEVDNFYARQFVWAPVVLAAGGSTGSTSLRPHNRGLEGLVGPGYFNADGYRVSNTGSSYWHAAVVRPYQEAVDVDTRIHTTLSTDPFTGFAANAGYSSRDAGLIDAVFMNRNVTGMREFDIGVLTSGTPPEYSGYGIRFVASEELPYDGSFTVDFGIGQYLELREFYVDATDLGLFSVIATVPGATETVTLGWLDKDFSTGDILDLTNLVSSDETGVAQLNVDVVEAGYYCVAVYREPFDAGVAKSDQPLSVQITSGPTPANLRAFTSLPGWDGPLIPRNAADASTSTVPEPTLLVGDVAPTWLNFATYNDGLADSPASSTEIRLDGQSVASYAVPSMFPYLNFLHINLAGPTVRGGRHLLSMHADDTNLITEGIEADNYFADQWVWEPAVLPVGSSVVRASPPAPDGGYDDIVYVVTLLSESMEGADISIFPEVYPNCDGLRLPLPAPVGDNGHWLAMAAMPNLKTNVDLRLHEASTGARDGFTDALAGSFEGDGRSDYILVNFREESPRLMDVGVLRSGGGTSTYLAESVASTWLGSSPESSYGVYTLASGEILDLHELFLDAGEWIISLQNVGAAIDYGLALHGGPPNGESSSFFGPTDTPEGGSSVVAEPGEDLTLQVGIAPGTEGYYCIAVRKRLTDDTSTEGEYKLSLTRSGTDTPSTPLADNGTRMRGVHPNPFNPRTTVVFELPQAERVLLEVYDLRGRRVRELLNEVRPAGRHEVIFDGVDAEGRNLASGTYFVRMTTPAGTEVRKASLIK